MTTRTNYVNVTEFVEALKVIPGSTLSNWVISYNKVIFTPKGKLYSYFRNEADDWNYISLEAKHKSYHYSTVADLINKLEPAVKKNGKAPVLIGFIPIDLPLKFSLYIPTNDNIVIKDTDYKT